MLLTHGALCMFEARPGRSLFSTDGEKYHCHVESLLEPPRKPATPVTGSASVASSSGQRRVERSVARTNNTSVAGSLIHGIASRLRARSSASVNYKDDDYDTDVDDSYENGEVGDYIANDVAYLDDDEDFDVCDDDGDEGVGIPKQNSFVGDRFGSLDALNHKMKETLASEASEGMDSVLSDGDESSVSNNADDAEWNPRKLGHQRRVKRTQPSVCLKVKLKTDPELDNELNAIQNDSTGCEVASACQSKPLVHNKRGRKPALAPKSLAKKWKHVGHRKSHLQTDAKNRVRGPRSKDGPKWEKKVSILFCYLIFRTFLGHYETRQMCGLFVTFCNIYL